MTDYISREAAYSIAKKVVDAIANGEYHAGVFAYDIMDWIDELPAADVRPVVHGRWQNPEDAECYQCSVCGKYRNQEFGFNAPVFDKFCPNCGADMREES